MKHDFSRSSQKILMGLVMPLLVFFVGCKDEGGGHKPDMSGSKGEMLIVMDDSVKNAVGGETIQNIMRQQVQGLPQAERLFDISVIPHRAFGERLRSFRNLVIVNMDPEEETEIKFYKDRWAKQQAMVQIYAGDAVELDSLLDEEEVRLTSFFVSAERERSQRYYRRYINKELTEKFKDEWDAFMIIPTGYNENKPGKNFRWMSEESALTSKGLFVWSYDYTGSESISKSFLLNKRDSVLKKNVPGPSEGSYMNTESRLPVTYKRFNHNDHQVTELRGLWKVEGDLMGGPFVCFAHVDEENDRVVVTDGYIYAPEKPEKRNLVWEMESILFSFRFLDEDEEDDE
ncbi:MAG: DUF4837 family protein [Marinilabiliaceae bacterium]